jgi:hypothetical protein
MAVLSVNNLLQNTFIREGLTRAWFESQRGIIMSAMLTADVLQDAMAVSLACAIAAANRRAYEMGVNPQERFISIWQPDELARPFWQINYGLRDYHNKRGGDLLIAVEADGASIQRAVWGQ